MRSPERTNGVSETPVKPVSNDCIACHDENQPDLHIPAYCHVFGVILKKQLGDSPKGLLNAVHTANDHLLAYVQTLQNRLEVTGLTGSLFNDMNPRNLNLFNVLINPIRLQFRKHPEKLNLPLSMAHILQLTIFKLFLPGSLSFQVIFSQNILW